MRRLAKELWCCLIFGAFQKKNSDHFLSSICCMLCRPLYRCVHICTCNDFAMYLSRIYTYGPYGGVSMSHGNQHEVAKAHLRRKRCVTGTVLQTVPCQKARSISNQQNFEGLLLDVMTYCVHIYVWHMHEWFFLRHEIMKQLQLWGPLNEVDFFSSAMFR